MRVTAKAIGSRAHSGIEKIFDVIVMRAVVNIRSRFVFLAKSSWAYS